MKPILENGIESFITEPDEVLAEGAILANLKLIEGVVATYPDDVELLEMAAMARANYAFGFVQDELEALRLTYPERVEPAAILTHRLQLSYRSARGFAERALAERNGDWAEAVAEGPLETLSPEVFERALETLTEDEAPALFWLAFAWGGSLQASLDPAEATQLPKIERAIQRILVLDDRVFYGVGPHLLAGVFYGFRAPALGGDPEAARRHFAKAKELGGVLLPDVLLAQFVHAQTEAQEPFERTLESVIAAESRSERGLLEALAKKKACRLLANLDQFFLADPRPVPEACALIPHKFPLRADEEGEGPSS